MSYLFMLVGIPGSGKSTFASRLAEEYNAQIFSSDFIRGELYGDESIQSNPKVVFEILHRRLINSLNQNFNVIYDATNIHSKYRKEFLESLPENKDRYNICYVCAERPQTCINRQNLRERKVPDEVIYRMANNMQYPTYDEGWDEIHILHHNMNEDSLLGWEPDTVSLLDYILYHKNWKEELENPPFCLNIRQKGDLYIFKYQQLNSDFHYIVVQESRGCILEIKDNIPVYICRPFTKFFNVQEELASPIDWRSSRVTEKVDGSLMKMFYYNGQWNLATNGTINAFEANVSDLDISFGQIFERVLGDSIVNFGTQYLNPDYTYMFELTSPETRVVISYPDRIYYLSRKRNSDGMEENDIPSFPKSIFYPKVYKLHKLEDIIKVVEMMTKEEEGVVVKDKYNHRVKVKSNEYLMAAKCVGNHNHSNSTLFEMVLEGKEDDLLAHAPEYTERVEKIKNAIRQVLKEMEDEWNKIKDTSVQISQKEFANLVKGNKYSDFLFKKRRFGDKTADEYFMGSSRSSQWRYIENLL